MQSVIIKADGLQKKVDPANGKDFSLEELNCRWVYRNTSYWRQAPCM